MKAALLLSASVSVSVAAAAGGFVYPRELSDDAAVDAILDKDGDVHLPISFSMPVDHESDDASEISFIAESMTVHARSRSHSKIQQQKAEEPPVMCETICRPINDTELEGAEAAAAYAANAGSPEGDSTVAAASSADLAGASSLLQIERRICTSQGGSWNSADGSCDPFMRTTSAAIAYSGEDVFKLCQTEFSTDYVPCNPYQALALAHLYDVKDHAYYWLWPGGRFDQVSRAVFKQEAGHNPREGMDRCAVGQHLGFFHNWDEAHVDSWGCLADESVLQVLCCRRG